MPENLGIIDTLLIGSLDSLRKAGERIASSVGEQTCALISWSAPRGDVELSRQPTIVAKRIDRGYQYQRLLSVNPVFCSSRC